MCMNCGCRLPHDQHGHPANITVEDLQQAADANHQSLRETVDHIVETLAVYEREVEGEGSGSGGGAGGSHGLEHPAGGQPAPTAERGTPETES